MRNLLDRIRGLFSRNRDDDYYDDEGYEDDGSGPVDAIRVSSGNGVPPALGEGETEGPTDGIDVSPFATDLKEVRWMTQREALVVASQELDPELWTDGRMAFEWERTIAHQHEGIRQRLATWVNDQTKFVAQDLSDQAKVVVNSLELLKDADAEAVHTVKEWHRVYDEVQSDASELARFDRIRSSRYKLVKWLFWSGLVAAEGAITFLIFKNLTGPETTDKMIAFLMSIGVMLAMVLVPHYAAIALREGTTRVHKYKKKYMEDHGFEPSYDLNRSVDHEEIEDRGGRWLAIALAVILIAAVVPLSLIRAHDFQDNRVDKIRDQITAQEKSLAIAQAKVDANEKLSDSGTADSSLVGAVADRENKIKDLQFKLDRAEGDSSMLWVFFFILFQLLISLYFFLREWSDHGASALHLSNLIGERKKVLKARQHARGTLVDAVLDYHYEAEEMVYLLRQAPHWDNQIVESYLTTLWYFRHVLTDAHPELGEFIHNAVIPSLQSQTAGDATGTRFVLEPTSWENAQLEAENHFGRTRWIEDSQKSLGDRPLPEVEDEDGDQRLAGTWLLTRDPMAYLDLVLAQFGHQAVYRRPPELDDTDFIDDEDPLELVYQAQFEDWHARRESGDAGTVDPGAGSTTAADPFASLLNDPLGPPGGSSANGSGGSIPTPRNDPADPLNAG